MFYLRLLAMHAKNFGRKTEKARKMFCAGESEQEILLSKHWQHSDLCLNKIQNLSYTNEVTPMLKHHKNYLKSILELLFHLSIKNLFFFALNKMINVDQIPETFLALSPPERETRLNLHFCSAKKATGHSNSKRTSCNFIISFICKARVS